MSKPRWQLARPAPLAELRDLMRVHRVSPALAQLLFSRQISGPEQLQPALVPHRSPGMQKAAEEIWRAAERGSRLRIHGDYDADGTCAAALLKLGFDALGVRSDVFLPDRLSEGYGISAAKVAEHAASCQMLITVDCGISDRAEIAALQAAGVQVVVTDHHALPERLPDCRIVHPALHPQYRPGAPALSGAGVAYHLLWTIYELAGRSAPGWLCDLAAIGTIADLVPLLGENRALVAAGLAQLARTVHPGLIALTASAGVSAPSASEVAFRVAPVLNAGGRMGRADLSLAALLAKSQEEARQQVAELQRLNLERRKLQLQILEEARGRISEQDPAIVLADQAWHQGVLGIVAGQLAARFGKPTYLIGRGRGSARGVPGIDILQSLRSGAVLLQGLGGHRAAAGFEIGSERVSELHEHLNRFVAANFEAHPVVAELVFQEGMSAGQLAGELAQLEPFGKDFEQPSWLLCGEGRRLGQLGSNGWRFELSGQTCVLWGEPQPAMGKLQVLANLQVHPRFGPRFQVGSWQPPGPLGLVGEASPGPFLRREVRDVLGWLAAQKALDGVAVFADPEGLRYLRAHYPQLAPWVPGQQQPGHLLLLSLPEEEGWAGLRGIPEVSVAWGPRTLAALTSRSERSEPAAAYLLQLLVWGHRHLGSRGFSALCGAALLG